MPTLEEWGAALEITRYARVDSTNALATNVNAKPASASFDGVSKTATSLPDFSPPRDIPLTASELLLYLGRITTPQIENLVDLYSTWAKIRYIWAFRPDPNPSNLCLSDEALNIDFHQKGLMSDEIGVGMAALITERYFDGKNPVDVDLAFRNQIIPGLTYQYSTSPDYLFERQGGGYIVVECKGTRSKRSNSYKQLKRGTEQLPSLVFASGLEPLGLVIGTKLSDSMTDVFVIDPPSKGDSNMDKRKYIVEDERQLKSNLDAFYRSNLYLFSGANSLAAEAAPDEKVKEKLSLLQPRDHPPEQIRISEMEEDYVGEMQEIRLIGDANRLSIFRGVSSSVFGVLSQRDIALAESEAAMHFSKARSLSRETRSHDNLRDLPGPVFVERGNNLVRANAFGKDGTLLRIEVVRG